MAIAEGLASRIARGEVSGQLAGARVVELSVAGMLAGTMYHGIQVDASNMLKPALVRGRLRCLGATTHEEYQRYFAKDLAFERRFQKVHVAELNGDGTVAILRGLKAGYKEHHGMRIQDVALVTAVRLSAHYIPPRNFPDKAIDLVDKACAAARQQKDFRSERPNNKDEKIGPDHIAQIVSKWTGIPVMRLGQDERKRLLDLPKTLQQRVVGQDEPAHGHWQDELAKALAEQLFGDESMLIRIDMSEYVGSSSVARLIGAAPGAVGFENGRQLTELVRQRPYSVVLFDEVEKGDPAVFNLFLQVLDDGRLTDGHVEEEARQLVFAEVQSHFRPELINRLDEMVVFSPLSGDTLRVVARMQLAAIAKRLDVSDAAVDVLLSRAGDQVNMYGARPIRRCLQKHLMTRVSQMMMEEEVHHGFHISVDADQQGKELVFANNNNDGSWSTSLADFAIIGATFILITLVQVCSR
ncbi:hypothetical protein QOZ80_3BG0276450 [Eleusine coracana subsp. coracana]|nr:hypothetical protein QOZ80_3BG0276450 [Eleusine coracana subsp. coracana]